MNKIGLLFEQLHHAETDLAGEYRKVGERQAAEQEVWHSCHDFARRAGERAAAVRRLGARYGKELSEPGEWDGLRTVVAHARHAVSEALGRRPSSGLLLLGDLRHLYLEAEQVNVHWIMLGQVVQAGRDGDALGEVDRLHRSLLTEIKWIKTRIKEAAPQVLVVG